MVDDTLAHENWIILGGVLFGHLSVLDVAHPFCFVPTEGGEMFWRHLRPHNGGVLSAHRIFQLIRPCAFSLFRACRSLHYIWFIHRAVEFVGNAEDGCHLKHGLVDARDTFFAHNHVDRVYAMAVLTEVDDFPRAATRTFLVDKAGRGRTLATAYLEFILRSDHRPCLWVVVKNNVKAVVGLII